MAMAYVPKAMIASDYGHNPIKFSFLTKKQKNKKNKKQTKNNSCKMYVYVTQIEDWRLLIKLITQPTNHIPYHMYGRRD
jgi:hypothetical protein